MISIKCFLKYYMKLLISCVLHIFWLFPVKKEKILLMNDHSYNFSDNLKYLAIYLANRDKGKYRIFFSLKNADGLDGIDIIPIRFLSLKHFYHSLTSGVVITNNSGIVYLPIRKKKQLVINTWHGGGPYKATGDDAIGNRWYAKDLEYNAEKVDYYLSSCRMCSETEAKVMHYKQEQIVESGMPRMDCFFDSQQMKELRQKVFQTFQIPASSKLIVYAPTFRGLFENYENVIANDILEIDYHRLIMALEKRFGGEWVFAVRLHPRLKNVHFKETDLINMSFYPDAEEILVAADVLVTDYSSVMWDFSFSKKPIFLFAPDINDYEIKRGFFMPPEKWPYPIATSNNDMEQIVADYNPEEYLDRLQKHYQEVGNNEKGDACEKIKELIDKHINCAC